MHDQPYMDMYNLAEALLLQVKELQKLKVQRDEMPQDVATLVHRIEELEEDVAKWKQAATLEKHLVDNADGACATLRADNELLRERAERLEAERDEALKERDEAQLRVKQLEALGTQ